ncbi:phosphopantetheine-binding protein [Metasolibacillus meyeri]|uniref:Acyl carrier protein n=1 Tax=Metasolibacillus meyeri TaxID=1071052 RepID=A0AAW9NTM5_9BACL|nr:phosphopantetheine-binding protein [Metasolibacillus meyeri]MEC1178644.1 phosphopantetheine-binding protein [Metasolibacillus meyeri]
MIKDNIENKVHQIISTLSNTENNSFTGNESLYNDLGFDSLKIVELIIELEQAFDISIDDEEIDFETLDSINNIINLITKRTKYLDIIQ